MGWLWFALEMKAAVSVGHTGWLGLTDSARKNRIIGSRYTCYLAEMAY